MHNNYYFLKHLSKELEENLLGYELIEIFSQNKDELILGFVGNNTSFYIKAHLQSDFCCLYFTEEFQRSRKNSVNLFKVAIHKKVIAIRQFKNERCFSVELEENFRLLFKMHGNRSNIILFNKNTVISLFKNSLKQDLSINIDELDREIDQSFKAFIQHDSNYIKLFPTFGKLPAQYLKTNNYLSLEQDKQWECIQNLLSEFNKSNYYIIESNGIITLSLMKMGEIKEEVQSPIEAINSFYLKYIRTNHFNKEKKQAIGYLEKKKKQTENYIIKTSKKLEEILKSTNHEILANIIMANLHQIPLHVNKVSLTNFYDNSEIIIKLNAKLSPQKNAENYYRKSKNQKIEIQNLKEAISKKNKNISLYTERLNTISSCDNISDLRKLLKEKSFQSSSSKNHKEMLPYHNLSFDGFSIWIGKNAKNNDVLTQKLAWKEDLWLHAKDVSGSHVIIKHQSGKNVPKHVIEKAAKWAAFYSKRKTESLCPVIVTPKKFVRKPKGLPSGAVVVDKEEVILVTPEKPPTTQQHSS
ncbi:MAG: NFACT RNA binding domain-containing protein [Cyclobacteriaceae bacterium]|nr:NFACT RNA binding domain-containing protein [Cyclobacteriaceae bacterium]